MRTVRGNIDFRNIESTKSISVCFVVVQCIKFKKVEIKKDNFQGVKQDSFPFCLCDLRHGGKFNCKRV